MRFLFISRRAGLSHTTTPTMGRRLATRSPVQPERKTARATLIWQVYKLTSVQGSGGTVTRNNNLGHLREEEEAETRKRQEEDIRLCDEGGRWKRWSCYPCRGAQVALTIHAHQRTYPSTTTHPPCLPLCFWMFEHWPSLVTPYPTHLRESHNGAPPKALNSKLSFRPA